MTYFNFIDLTTQVRIEYGNGVTIIQYFLYPKNTLAVSVLGNVLTVSETESAQLVVQVDYSTDTVIAPTSVDIDDLATQLAAMFGSAGGGAGDASAANQVIQIGLETNMDTTLSNMEGNQTSGSQVTQVSDSGGDFLAINNDGSINVNIPGNLPFTADALLQSNPDVNGNYQTIQYYIGGLAGTVVKTVNLTYDANNNVVSYEEV